MRYIEKNISEIIRTIGSSGAVLCVSDKQARYLRAERVKYLALVKSQGAWKDDLVFLSVSDFFVSIFNDGFPSKQLLHPVQSLLIVKKVIDQSSLLPPEMMSSMSVARQVLKAYTQLIDYEVKLQESDCFFNNEVKGFVKNIASSFLEFTQGR